MQIAPPPSGAVFVLLVLLIAAAVVLFRAEAPSTGRAYGDLKTIGMNLR